MTNYTYKNGHQMAYTKQAMLNIAELYDCELHFEECTKLNANGFLWTAVEFDGSFPIAKGHAVRYSPSSNRYATIKQCRTLSLMLSIATGKEFIPIQWNDQTNKDLHQLANICSQAWSDQQALRNQSKPIDPRQQRKIEEAAKLLRQHGYHV